jgi:hypothetical protein
MGETILKVYRFILKKTRQKKEDNTRENLTLEI